MALPFTPTEPTPPTEPEPVPVAAPDEGHPNAADKPIEDRYPAGVGTDQGNPPYAGEGIAVTDAATGETTFVPLNEAPPQPEPAPPPAPTPPL